jgi:hypothetical protein
MVRVICKNDIGGFNANSKYGSLDYATEIEIVSTWENLTDTCNITMPNRIRAINSAGVHTNFIVAGSAPLWKRLDPVIIRLGYQYKDDSDNLITQINPVFSGRIRKILPDKPLQFECEDSMIDMKRFSVTNYSNKKLLSGGQTTLDLVIADVFKTAGVNLATAFIFPVVINCEKIIVQSLVFKGTFTLAEIINYFTGQPFHLFCYFKDKVVGGVITQSVLNIGFPTKLGIGADPTSPAVGRFDFNDNIFDSKLDFQRSDDILIQVTAKNFNSNNTKSTPIIVDGTKSPSQVKNPLAEQRTIFTWNLKPEAVRDIANQYLYAFKYTGMRGSFTTCLLPQVRHGDIVELVDDTVEDRNGKYLVKQVTTRLSMDGGTQEIFIDQKIQ